MNQLKIFAEDKSDDGTVFYLDMNDVTKAEKVFNQFIDEYKNIGYILRTARYIRIDINDYSDAIKFKMSFAMK